VNRREFILGVPQLFTRHAGLGFSLADSTAGAGINFRHNSGAFGGKYLPETLGAGCAVLDYDRDGWQDILLINGMDWPSHKSRRTTMRLYHNNRNGTFTDVTRRAGLDIEMYGMGVAVGDYNNDGFPDILVTCVGQNRLFQNTGRGTFVDVTTASGLGGRQGFSSSAVWLDYDRDGLLDLFVCNYVKWSPDSDVFCSLDGQHKSYCTPEAYRGATCWLFHNRGDGSFEDVTAGGGIFDTSSKSLGVAMFDHDLDGWIDLFVANDTQPNKLFRNMRDGTFQDIAMKAGVAFSEDGKIRAGMGVDAADYDNSGIPGLVVTNFDHEMLGLYHGSKSGSYIDQALRLGVGEISRRRLGFGCFFFDVDLDGMLDLLVVNGHIDEGAPAIQPDSHFRQPPHLFLNKDGSFYDAAPLAGGGFAEPKVGRGAAFGDFDNDGDLDFLITTNNGPAYLYRNDQMAGNRSIRFHLIGAQSNRDAIGATIRIFSSGLRCSRMIRSGSSYLSQSELPVTFGLGKRDVVQRTILHWPSGRIEEYRNLKPGKYCCTEAKGIQDGCG
jgi:hypothetical protein